MAAAALPPIGNTPFVDSRGYLTVAAVQLLQQLQNQSLGGGIGPSTVVTGLGQYRNDAQASAAGVPRWGLYMNGSVLSVQKDFP